LNPQAFFLVEVYLVCVVSVLYELHVSLICDKSVTTQNLTIFELLVQKKTFADALLTGVVS